MTEMGVLFHVALDSVFVFCLRTVFEWMVVFVKNKGGGCGLDDSIFSNQLFYLSTLTSLVIHYISR